MNREPPLDAGSESTSQQSGPQPQPPQPPPQRPQTVQPRQSAIRLRRLSTWRPGGHHGANPENPEQVQSMLDVGGDDNPDQQSIRLRRTVRTEPYSLNEASNVQPVRSMLDVDGNHETGANARDEQGTNPYTQNQSSGKQRPGLFRGGRAIVGRRRKNNGTGNQLEIVDEYDPNIVDMLDVVDPEVSTLSSITNVQNSLFVPSLGRWVNRRPTYNLSRLPHIPGSFALQDNVVPGPVSPTNVIPEIPEQPEEGSGEPSRPSSPSSDQDAPGRPSIERIPSVMTDRFYAVRPHNTSLADWSDEDLAELNDHVRHMLHSRRSAFKRGMKAFGQYVRRPLGFFVTLYATLITMFGLAWVLFLIGWIYVGEKQLYVINVIDNVLVALFAVVGDGMIPWRAVDTYHMIYIARYTHLTWKLRDQMSVPELKDKNDLPAEPVVSTRDEQHDIEAARHFHTKEERSVLTPKQQTNLEHHQAKFSKSHTFYKPHETETHYAFPLRFLVAIVVLLDCHSCFQLALGLCTWCIDYRTRPGALTATILSCSIAVNTTAGILISVGDRKTRKKDVVERIFRQELTEEAMRRVQHRKEKDAAEKERLHKIEEEGRDASSNHLTLLRPNLDFLHRSSTDSQDRPRKSMDKSRKSMDKSRKIMDKSRKSMDKSRKSMDKSRKSMDQPRKPPDQAGRFDVSMAMVGEDRKQRSKDDDGGDDNDLGRVVGAFPSEEQGK